ncbi:MAG: hypothetical protein KDD64_09090 [Bdellovibrionales bacterium]|nr:hypothetical protein [Bdellovibrionales bacterium]
MTKLLAKGGVVGIVRDNGRLWIVPQQNLKSRDMEVPFESWSNLVALCTDCFRSNELKEDRASVFGSGDFSTFSDGYEWMPEFGENPDPAYHDVRWSQRMALYFGDDEPNPTGFRYKKMAFGEASIEVDGDLVFARFAANGMSPEELFALCSFVLSHRRTNEGVRITRWNADVGEDEEISPSFSPFLFFVLKQLFGADVSVEEGESESVAAPAAASSSAETGTTPAPEVHESTPAASGWTPEGSRAGAEEILKRHGL